MGITAQGLETIDSGGNDKKLIARLDEIINEYKVDTIVIGIPLLLNGDKSERTITTEKFIHKLKCKYNKLRIVMIDERLTTVEAHKTMNDLKIKKRKKRRIGRYNICSIYIRNIHKQK